MYFKQTWRWFGTYDTISLSEVKQTGATGIVTALHHIPHGDVWPVEEIQKRKSEIEDAGLTWPVVESVPVHEDIKTQSGNYKTYIENYKQTIRNLAQCGIRTLCYNFMPVMDWTRTDLKYALEDGAIALSFEVTALAAFDLFILKRKEAANQYSNKQKEEAKKYFDSLDSNAIENLSKTILMGLPGDEEISLEKFRHSLKKYSQTDDRKLRSNLHHFLKEIIPVAGREKVYMAIHPDDPPFSILGLPRVVSTEADAHDLLEAVDSPFNGLTFCTGSFGARSDNDLPGMIKRLGHRINFIHLRSVKRKAGGSFHEARHLEGDADMFHVVYALIREQQRRKNEGRRDLAIPMRPDHGHQILDDINKKAYPGYSALGRLRGLAELRGLEMGIRKMLTE